MFGKPEWFIDKTFGWGLYPITWQGWLYTAIWSAVLVLPFWLLLALHKPWEAGIWLTIMSGALIVDVAFIKRARVKSSEPSSGSSNTSANSKLETRHFDMHLRP